MTWVLLAIASALLLGFYDVSKKQSLRGNAVIPVLLLHTLFSSIIFLPCVLLSAGGLLPDDHILHTATYGWEQQRFILLKSTIVLSSWLFGYYGMKWLPITLVGPINATRPVMVLIGALTLFGERLGLWQWLGVLTAMLGLWMLSRSGKKEGIRFAHNKWILCVFLSNVLGALSALYDKFLLASPENGGVGLDKVAVQSYFNFYQLGMMALVFLLLCRPFSRRGAEGVHAFRWRWSIPLISIFIACADFAYFYCLSLDGAMVSIVSMLRRGSVVVSFTVGALLFGEGNLRAKAIDLALVLLSMVFLCIGSLQ